MLEQVRDLVLVHGRLDGDRRQRVVLALLERLASAAAAARRSTFASRLQHRVAALLRQVGGPELHRRAGHVADDHALPARSRIGPRGASSGTCAAGCSAPRQVAVAGEHLQRPEAEEEHGEDDERERAEHADPERELRREAGTAPPTRGSGGRKRRDEERRWAYGLAKEPHLRDALGDRRRAQQDPASSAQTGAAEEQVAARAPGRARRRARAAPRRLAEQRSAGRGPPKAIEDRDDDHRDERRVRRGRARSSRRSGRSSSRQGVAGAT